MPNWFDSAKALSAFLKEHGCAFQTRKLANMSGMGKIIGSFFVHPDPETGGFWIHHHRAHENPHFSTTERLFS